MTERTNHTQPSQHYRWIIWLMGIRWVVDGSFSRLNPHAQSPRLNIIFDSQRALLTGGEKWSPVARNPRKKLSGIVNRLTEARKDTLIHSLTLSHNYSLKNDNLAHSSPYLLCPVDWQLVDCLSVMKSPSWLWIVSLGCSEWQLYLETFCFVSGRLQQIESLIDRRG